MVFLALYQFRCLKCAHIGKILALQNFITFLDSRFSKSVVSIATTMLAVLSLKGDETISR